VTRFVWLAAIALSACTNTHAATCVVDSDCAQYAEPGEALFCDTQTRECTLIGDAGVRDMSPPPSHD
jgi:hypothetical protein